MNLSTFFTFRYRYDSNEEGRIINRHKATKVPVVIMFSGIICLLTNYGCITAISPISAISADAACKKKAYGFIQERSKIYYNQNVYYDCMAAEGLYCETKTYDGWCEMWGTPLHLAASNDSKSEVELLLSKGANVNVKNDIGWTPLHSAVAQGHKGMAELLLTKGAKVNAKSSNGITPLYWAVYKGKKDIVELLLSNKADVNTKTNNGWTPLSVAAYRGNKDIVELLLSKGAEVNTKTDKGHTPLHFAMEKDHKDVVRLLLQHGGKSN
jgi:hypothetical protein